MRTKTKSLIGIFILGIFIIGFMGQINAMSPGTVDVNSDKHQTKQQANQMVTYRFRSRTQVRVNSSANLSLNMDCDAMNIGDRTFELDVNSSGVNLELQLNMTMRKSGEDFGINASKIQNRVRARLQHNFAIHLETNGTIHARLRLEMSAQEAQNKAWAYYNETLDEWVPVETTYEDGMLTADTDHFSTWTIIETVPTISFGSALLIVTSLLASMAVLLVLKRRNIHKI
ncbi:MAG: hypothetical protein ACTSU2_05445 [Promethearchaeota archaeon]